MSAVLEPRAPGPRRLSLSHRGGCGGPASAGGANSVRHVALETGTSDPSAGIRFRAAPERERVPPPPTFPLHWTVGCSVATGFIHWAVEMSHTCPRDPGGSHLCAMTVVGETTVHTCCAVYWLFGHRHI